jgi:hypothetical protein
MIDTCLNCGSPLPAPKRGQPRKYCSNRCRVAAHRESLCVTEPAPLATHQPMRYTAPAPPLFASEAPRSHELGSNADGSTPGALQGDYPLEYYEDGYPKLPACLDRRRKPEPLAEAA